MDKPNYFVYTRHEPVGVVGDYTLETAAAAVDVETAAGLAAICTWSQAERPRPDIDLRFAKLFAEAGFHPHQRRHRLGPETGAALASHRVSKIAFTGSTATGIRVGKAAIEDITRFSLELGGESAQVVSPMPTWTPRPTA